MLYLGLEVTNYGISSILSLLGLFKSHLYVLKPSANLLFIVIHLFYDSKGKFGVSLTYG